MKWTIGVLLVAACGFAQAVEPKTQVQSVVCDRLAAAVNDGAKELSFIDAEGVGDDSAPRGSYREQQKVVTTNLMQMNLNLMQSNKCQLPKEPFSGSAYFVPALKCSTALSARSMSGDKVALPECDRSKWSKDS